MNEKVQDEDGKTPLDIAYTLGHGPSVASMHKHGGNTGEEWKADAK